MLLLLLGLVVSLLLFVLPVGLLLRGQLVLLRLGIWKVPLLSLLLRLWLYLLLWAPNAYTGLPAHGCLVCRLTCVRARSGWGSGGGRGKLLCWEGPGRSRGAIGSRRAPRAGCGGASGGPCGRGPVWVVASVQVGDDQLKVSIYRCGEGLDLLLALSSCVAT